MKVSMSRRQRKQHLKWRPSKQQRMIWLAIAGGFISLLAVIIAACGAFFHWDRDQTAAAIAAIAAVGTFIKFVQQVLQNGVVAEANVQIETARNEPAPEQHRADAATQPGYVAVSTPPEG